jgi:hypothetical protein
LTRYVVLHLAICLNLALQPDELFGALIDPAQHLQPHRSRHNQEKLDCEKCRQQLDPYASRYA